LPRIPARPVLAQFLLLGAVLAFGGFFINGAVGLAAGGIGQRLAQSTRFVRALGVISAGVFTALALRLALQQRG
jgi:threonine/homoserine/homoserine lactone efflux protein